MNHSGDNQRQRQWATVLLIVMGLVFVGTHFFDSSSFWLRLVRSGAEAGVIGGLVDWFAIVALFRHPLGIPIPHTAVVRNSKERIANGIGMFINTNLNEPKKIADMIKKERLSRRVADWLNQPANTEAAAAIIANMIPKLIEPQYDVKIRVFLLDEITRRLKEGRAAPPLGRLLNVLYQKKHLQLILKELVGFLEDFLNKNPHFIEEAVSRKTGFLIKLLDSGIARKVEKSIREFLKDVSREDHPLQRELNNKIEEIIDDLQQGKGIAKTLERRKVELLDSPQIRNQIGDMLDDIRKEFLGQGELDAPKLKLMLSSAFQQFAASLAQNKKLQDEIDARLSEAAREIGPDAVKWAGDYAIGVLNDWSSDKLAEKLEDAVGKDLQYIRINGTILGFILGAVIFLATDLIA